MEFLNYFQYLNNAKKKSLHKLAKMLKKKKN